MAGEILPINFGDLAKPATVLVEKISAAIGGVFEPWQIRRIAKAEAEADKIQAIAKIEITKLEQRALQRFMYEEARKQNNIESITSRALPQLTEKAKPEKVDEDWIINFFDKCRLVSDEEMQALWSRILAGEANTPGSFSKITINLMASLEKEDALLFTKLCGFNWTIGGLQPLVYNPAEEIYKKEGVDFVTLKHLDAIGLISFDSLAGYLRKGFSKKAIAIYKNVPFELEFLKEKDNELQIGHIMFTHSGSELAKICSPKNITGFVDYVIQQWTRVGIKVLPLNNPVI